jgi:hypothetical protein
MKRAFFTSAIALLALLVTTNLMTSCRWSLEMTQSNRKSEEAISRNIIGVGVVQMPTVADLEISPKRENYNYEITVMSEKLREKQKELEEERYKKKEVEAAQAALEALNDRKERNIESALDGVKAIAKSKMLIQFDADVLIDPRYSVEVENNEKISVLVSGYLGKYKNFRNMTMQDTALLKCPVFYIYPQRTIGEIEVTK